MTKPLAQLALGVLACSAWALVLWGAVKPQLATCQLAHAVGALLRPCPPPCNTIEIRPSPIEGHAVGARCAATAV